MKSDLNPDQEPICDEKPCHCDDDDIIRDQTQIDDHFKVVANLEIRAGRKTYKQTLTSAICSSLM